MRHVQIEPRTKAKSSNEIGYVIFAAIRFFFNNFLRMNDWLRGKKYNIHKFFFVWDYFVLIENTLKHAPIVNWLCKLFMYVEKRKAEYFILEEIRVILL